MEVVVEGDRHTAVVAVHGSVDVFTVARLREHLLPLVLSGDRDVVVDCAGVTRIDATGLGVLVAALRIARRAGIGFGVATPTPGLRALLRETRLDRWLPVVDLPELAAAG